MAIRKSFEEMKVVRAGSASEARPNQESPIQTGAGDEREQTYDAACARLSLRVADAGVRADKVAMVRAGLAAGSYNVPAWAVASKMTRLGWEARRGHESLWNEVPLCGEAIPADSDFKTAQAVLHDVERLRELRANRRDHLGWQSLNWVAGQGKYGYN